MYLGIAEDLMDHHLPAQGIHLCKPVSNASRGLHFAKPYRDFRRQVVNNDLRCVRVFRSRDRKAIVGMRKFCGKSLRSGLFRYHLASLILLPMPHVVECHSVL